MNNPWESSGQLYSPPTPDNISYIPTPDNISYIPTPDNYSDNQPYDPMDPDNVWPKRKKKRNLEEDYLRILFRNYRGQ